jgi:preprotein translocase subunit SecE
MSKIKAYFEDTYYEMMHKVTWPTWKELQSYSIIVLVASVIFSLAIFVMDFVFGINSGAWKGVLGYYYGMMKG